MTRMSNENSAIKALLFGSAFGAAYGLLSTGSLVQAQPSSGGSPVDIIPAPSVAVPAPQDGKLLTGDLPQIEPPAPPPPDSLIARGRYLTVIAGCNDCHTAGFAPSGGSIPENDWLLGDGIGFRGPWGTTYPVNLRLYLKTLSEEQWLVIARSLKSRPPMPSYALNQMEEEDLRAIYRFVKSLGEETGDPVPAYVAPGTEPKTEYILFEPVAVQENPAGSKSSGKKSKTKK